MISHKLTTLESYAHLDAQREQIDTLRERSDGDESVWTVRAAHEPTDAPLDEWPAPYTYRLTRSTRAW